MKTHRTVIGGMLVAMIAVVMPVSSASAQSVEEFYKGKTLQIKVGFGVGGSYDTYARVLAEHIGRHIPGNPRAIVMNMEGAGSLRLANWLYNAAPKDGTVFGTTSRAAPFASLIGTQGGTNFDPTKFNWIGSANNEVSTCISWHTAAVKTFDQLRNTELIIGGDGPSADGEQFARVMNALFDTRIKIVSGYPGGNAINLAVERGEVQGRCGWSWSGSWRSAGNGSTSARSMCWCSSASRSIRPARCADDPGLRQDRGAEADIAAGARRANRSGGRSLRRQEFPPIVPMRCARHSWRRWPIPSSSRPRKNRSLRSTRCRARRWRLWSMASSPPCRLRPWRRPRKSFRVIETVPFCCWSNILGRASSLSPQAGRGERSSRRDAIQSRNGRSAGNPRPA